MKRTTLNRIIAVIIIITLFSVNNSNAQVPVYTTMNNGNWSDVVNVWSTDGGASPCGCTPGSPSGFVWISVDHNIVMDVNLILGGGKFTVSATGNLTGGKNVNTWNTVIDLIGNVSVGKWLQGTSVTTNLYPGSLFNASGQLSIGNGSFTMNGASVNSGKLDIAALGSLILTNSSKYTVVSGNATNNGLLHIGPLSCMASNGNWKNNASGTVAGSGSLNSGGNLQNSGTFSMATAWCATGSGLGLPTPEDCATSNIICNSITLPVELSMFVAEAVEKDYIQLDWETTSEFNNSHFILFSSEDGKDWTEVATVGGAGTSTETNYYSFQDENVRIGATYYKLIQYDFDGRSSESDVISVSVKGNDNQILIYPNPIRNNNELTIGNLEESDGEINILNISGQVVARQEITKTNSIVKVQLSDLLPGIYFVNVQQLGTFKTTRLVITE